ncbi:Lipoprotein-releasing system ATP-binding protein LolD [Anaerococcus prevotii]|uniref:ABC transporter related n=1 Tax=Anaerococcus prevotii (strain ATCC 9321 / DSM 20548 / JCM 6508 / NCTC 11806 / PC1) TaxID=525919 RepID=C7RH40_ANAPD|nr:ABC transporter ATP-binding protein [Anaerococcus prevotii]ACV28801.1 ABC transporter related [Anaerococcus prevotii DSM 20548]SUU94476.1 Lipoprotein-releasing system ATP-binding protein LolD [Anaerococcus prevotii]
MSYIQLNNLTKEFKSGDTKIVANDKINFSLEEGRLLIIVGASGAGKTTLLNLIGGMDKATSGEILIDGKNLVGLSDRDLTEYRRNDVGFVFQHYNLIPNLTALENVEMASEISDNPLEAEKILEEVGLSHRLNNFPSQLSGGEQQRVAIARALAKNPKLLLCDEPTGALDYETGKNILRLLQDASRKMGATVVIITHNSLIKPMADQVIEIRDGRVDKDYINENPVSVDEIEW